MPLPPALHFPLNTFIPSPPRWLWPGRIPLGKLTLLSGEPGVGKSLLAADLCARVTRGLPWPDGQPAPEPADVLLFSAEDDPADTLHPRILAAGGDPARVHVARPALAPDGTTSSIAFPRDYKHLESMLFDLKNPPLVIFDPLAAFLGDGGDFGRELQARINPLCDLAERGKFSILAITHRDLRVPTNGRRSASTLAYLATARTAFYVTTDERDPQTRRLLSIKNNLSEPAPDLAFRIDGEKVVWQPTANNAPPAPTERRLAAEWLLDFLKDGSRAATEIYEQAQTSLFAIKTIRRAARELGVHVRRQGFGGQWFWELVEKTPPENARPSTRDLATYGESTGK